MNADFTSHKPGELTGWLTQHVGAGARLLDLSQAGFRPVGGRLFAVEQGAAAMVIYKDATGQTISFYIRSPDSPQQLLAPGQRIDDGLLARYGSSQGLNYTVVGPANKLKNAVIVRAINGLT